MTSHNTHLATSDTQCAQGAEIQLEFPHQNLDKSTVSQDTSLAEVESYSSFLHSTKQHTKQKCCIISPCHHIFAGHELCHDKMFSKLLQCQFQQQLKYDAFAMAMWKQNKC